MTERRCNANLFRVAPLLCLALVLGLPGCATKPAAKKGPNFIFYPSPPETPRLQFLTSYSSGVEFRGGAKKFAEFVTGQVEAKNPILKPYGVAVRNNQLFVCDTALNAILILDLKEREMRGMAPKGEAIIKEPINIAVDADGTRYIADSGRNQVLVFDPQDKFLAAVGAKDEMKPRDVAIGKDRFYVADAKNNCVRVYAKDTRKLLATIPQGPDAEAVPTRLFQPTNLALDSKDQLHVTDTGAFRVQLYGADGKYVRTFGRNGDAPGEFRMPKGVAVDRQGRVFVVDAANQIIQIFDPEGQLLLWFGEPNGSDAPLDLPAKVIIDYDHVGLFQKYVAPDFRIDYLVIVTNQYGDRKVSVYGFGQKK